MAAPVARQGRIANAGGVEARSATVFVADYIAVRRRIRI